MSSKKLLEQCQKLEKLWSHVFTSTITLANITAENQWYNKLTDLIDKQQTAPIWMSESKPDESVSDDFLFPMSSGISYNSSPESDGEFCEPETPRNMSRQPSEEPSMPHLTRFNSDSNLANIEEVGTGKQIEKKHNPQQQTPEKHERSDSKYGFHNGQNNESVDELPLPPHPTHSPQRQISNVNGSAGGPAVPPKIERHKKPNRSPRETASNSSPTKHNSLDRPSQLGNLKMSVYDAYDPYNNYDSSPRYKPTNGGTNGYRSSASLHDPGYRQPNFEMNGYGAGGRAYPPVSHPPPIPSTDPNGIGYNSNGYNKPFINGNGYSSNGGRYPDYKPVPPPKTGPYKPVPPPKPRSNNGANEANYINNNNPYGTTTSSMHYHSSNVKPSNNGLFNRYNDDVDSGQGSSLDRDYGLYNNYQKSANGKNDQYYYNLPSQQQQNGGTPPRRSDGSAGLDLTNNREYRGSAFELYKKPLSEARPAPPAQNQYYANGNQSVAR